MNGIDISGYQSSLSPASVDADFVIIKATEGTGYAFSGCNEKLTSTIDSGKLAGLYHFATVGDAIAQADYFSRVVKSFTKYDSTVRLFLDWEADAIAQGSAWAAQFIQEVINNLGRGCDIYMSHSVCNEYDFSNVVSLGSALWVAQYASNNSTGYQNHPWVSSSGFGAWETYDILQYSSNGYINGYSGPLDINHTTHDATWWRGSGSSTIDRSAEMGMECVLLNCDTSGKWAYFSGDSVRYIDTADEAVMLDKIHNAIFGTPMPRYDMADINSDPWIERLVQLCDSISPTDWHGYACAFPDTTRATILTAINSESTTLTDIKTAIGKIPTTSTPTSSDGSVDYSTLYSTVTDMQATLTTIQSTLGGLQTLVSSLGGTSSGGSTIDTTSIQSELIGLQKTVTAINSAITALQTSVNSLPAGTDDSGIMSALTDVQKTLNNMNLSAAGIARGIVTGLESLNIKTTISS